MKLRNHTKFPGFLFRQYNPEGELNVAVTISALYQIVEGMSLQPLTEQREIQLSDEYTGPEAPTRHLLRQADFIPFKLGTDVTAIAKSWSPSGQAEKAWVTGIRVGNLDKVLRVHGPRYWQYTENNKWELSEAEPATSVPLDYYHAFGGKPLIDSGDKGEINAYNPLGTGIIFADATDKTKQYKAPQIEDQQTRIEDPYEEYVPQGLAPIHPAWRFREQYVGTYDEKWLKTEHPFLPPDFDYHFYNCAHPDLTFEPFLKGDEFFQLANLHPNYKQMHFQLPQAYWGAVASYKDGTALRTPLALDGVHFELLQTTPIVRLTWRAGFAWKTGIDFVDIGKTENPYADEAEQVTL